MGSPYTVAERQELTDRAVHLSARGWSARKIEDEIGVTAKTVRKWLGDEFANRAEMREQDKERAIARYEAVIEAAWERYDTTDSRSLNASGLLNTIRQAQDSINKITGAEAPLKVQDVTEDYEILWGDDDAGDASAAREEAGQA